MSNASQSPPESPGEPTPQQPGPTPPSAGPERDTTFGWLAHLLMIPSLWVGPLILWLVKKDEDAFAAFHAKQAMCWGVAVFVVMGLCTITCVLAWLTPVVWAAHLVYGVVATVTVAKGKPFKYLVVADKFCQAEFAAAYPELRA